LPALSERQRVEWARSVETTRCAGDASDESRVTLSVSEESKKQWWRREAPLPLYLIDSSSRSLP
jgi:hypothetical protein